MALFLTLPAGIASDGQVVEPQLVIKFDGITTCFGTTAITEKLLYGRPGAEYGDVELFYGGNVAIEDQQSLISMKGSTTSIKQQLVPEKGQASVSSFKVRLVDRLGIISALMVPGDNVPDFLGLRTNVFLGFADTAFPQDFVKIFDGVIDDIGWGAGFVDLSIAHPDILKRQDLFNPFETKLDGGIDASTTSVTLLSTAGLLVPRAGPDGSFDPSIAFRVKIDDELIEYTSVTGATLNGVVRGADGTTAAVHDDLIEAFSVVKLEDDVMSMALKLMLSPLGDFADDVDITNFVEISSTDSDPKAMFFQGQFLVTDRGLTRGDFFTTTGAAEAANDRVADVIDSVLEDEFGTVIITEGDDFVLETDSGAAISFRSQFDTWPEGLSMAPFQVDVGQHQKLRSRFLSTFSMRFFIQGESINGKEFIESDIFAPVAAYSLPRKGRSSVGFTIEPLPDEIIKQLDKSNMIKPSTFKIRRSLGKSFFNTMVYKFDHDPILEEFFAGVLTTDATSRTRIPVGTRALTFESKGLRSDLLGVGIATTSSTRKINRFKFGAELLERVKVLYGVGFNIEVGDLVLLDGADLNLFNTNDGSRNIDTRLWEVQNKELSIKEGNVTLSLINTSFDTSARFALIAPSSEVVTGLSATSFTIEESFAGSFGRDEFRKWRDFEGASILIKSPDGVIRNGTAILVDASSNTITLGAGLGFTPVVGDIMSFDIFDNQTIQVQLLYSNMSDVNFGDGSSPYQMI